MVDPSRGAHPFVRRNINCSSSCASTERALSKTSTAATPISVKARLWTPSGKTVGKRQRAIEIHVFCAESSPPRRGSRFPRPRGTFLTLAEVGSGRETGQQEAGRT
eukprot:s488_g4.t1